MDISKGIAALRAWVDGHVGESAFVGVAAALIAAMIIWVVAKGWSWTVSRALEVIGLIRGLFIRPALIFDSQIVPPDIDVVGRAADLRAIRRLFRRRCDAVAIVADGGYGKTELAAEYARQFSRGWPWRRYRGVWRLMAGSNAAALNDLQRLMIELGQPKEADIGSAVQAAKKALMAGGGRWLIIHDNAEDAPSAEVEARLLRGSRIDNLITSRKGDWTNRVEKHPLGELAQDDAVTLLAQVSGHEITADLRKLAVETIGGLPYLLVIAGARMKVAKLAPADLIAEFDTLLTLPAQTGGYLKTAHKVLEGSLRLLSPPDGPPDPEGEDALALLRLAAFMNPDDIDEGFLVEGAKAVAVQIAAGNTDCSPLPEPLASLAGQKLRRSAALARLDQLSLTTPGQWEGAPTRRLHRTTQRMLRDWMGDAAAVQIGLVGRLGRAQFSDNPQFDTLSWPRCQRLSRHAVAVAPMSMRAVGADLRAAASFVHSVAMFVRDASENMQLVRQLYEINLQNMIAAYGENSFDYHAALIGYGMILDDLCNNNAAEHYLLKARDLKYKLTKKDDPRRAFNHNALGNLYGRLERFDEAEKEFLESLRLRIKSDTKEELLGGAHGNLGWLYSKWIEAIPDAPNMQARRARALHHLIEGLRYTRAALRDKARGTAIRHSNLGTEYQRQGIFKAAFDHQLRAVAILIAMVRKKMISSDYPLIKKYRAALTDHLRALGREGEIDALLAAEVAALIDDRALDITPARTEPPA